MQKTTYMYLRFSVISVFIIIFSQVIAQPMMTTDFTQELKITTNPKEACVISNPSDGYVFYNPDLIYIEALVWDSIAVSRVDFYLDSLHLGTDTEFPYHNTKLFNAPMGRFKLNAIATFNNGLIVKSAPVQIIVRCVHEDLDNNGIVNIKDFLLLLGSFGLMCTACDEDFNQDGVVNTMDFLRFLASLGHSCN